jgi:hypothetical protein
MKDQGYSEDDIQDAMTSGASPEQWAEIEKRERKAEWENLKSLRDTEKISSEEFKKRKAEMFR